MQYKIGVFDNTIFTVFSLVITNIFPLCRHSKASKVFPLVAPFHALVIEIFGFTEREMKSNFLPTVSILMLNVAV